MPQVTKLAEVRSPLHPPQPTPRSPRPTTDSPLLHSYPGGPGPGGSRQAAGPREADPKRTSLPCAPSRGLLVVDADIPSSHLPLQAADLSSTSTILTTAATLAYKSSNYPLLNSTVTVLAKRHGQLKEAVVRMIDEVITFLPEMKTQEGESTWLDALKSLRNITEGKVRSLLRLLQDA